jgi:hypothetical protein
MNLIRLAKMCLNETYSNVCMGKQLSDAFPIQNNLSRMHHFEGLRKLGGIEIGWDTSASGLC